MNNTGVMSRRFFPLCFARQHRLLLSIAAGVLLSVTAQATHVLINDDFESDAVGGDPAGWVVSEPSPSEIFVTNNIAAPGSTQSVELLDQNGTPAFPSMTRNFSTVSTGLLDVDWWSRVDATGGDSQYIQLRNASNESVVAVRFDNSPSVFAYKTLNTPSTWFDTSTPYSANTWYNLRLALDFDTETFDFYVDGSLVANDIGFISDASSTDVVQLLVQGRVVTGTGTSYFDDLRITHDFVPEPSTLFLFGTGLAVLLRARKQGFFSHGPRQGLRQAG